MSDRIGRDEKLFGENLKKRGKRGRGRPLKLIDPEDPTTWPKRLETKREKLMYLFDILSGNRPGTYKQKWIEERYSDAKTVDLRLTRDIIEDIADLNAVYKHGGFRNLPQPVAEAIVRRFSTRPGPLEEEDLYSTDPMDRPLTPQDIIAISLMIAKFHFMAANPVFSHLMKTTTDVYGHKVGLRHLANVAGKMATYSNMFDLDGYDDI